MADKQYTAHSRHNKHVDRDALRNGDNEIAGKVKAHMQHYGGKQCAVCVQPEGKAKAHEECVYYPDRILMHEAEQGAGCSDGDNGAGCPFE